MRKAKLDGVYIVEGERSRITKIIRRDDVVYLEVKDESGKKRHTQQSAQELIMKKIKANYCK